MASGDRWIRGESFLSTQRETVLDEVLSKGRESKWENTSGVAFLVAGVRCHSERVFNAWSE